MDHIIVVWDRFGRSLRFCHLEFDKEAISDGFMAHSRVFRGETQSKTFYQMIQKKTILDLSNPTRYTY